MRGRLSEKAELPVGVDLDRDEQHRVRVAIPFLLIHAFRRAQAEIVDGLEAAKISLLNVTQRLKSEGPQHAPTTKALPCAPAAECTATPPIERDRPDEVLVPFLLSTAVFTRLSVIDLSLPASPSNAVGR